VGGSAIEFNIWMLIAPFGVNLGFSKFRIQMVLVTGATGLLGSKLLADLIIRGVKVRALTRSISSRRRVLRYHLQELDINDGSVEWIEGDITNYADVMDAVSGIDFVFHCAGLVSFLPIEQDALRLINVQGTANIVNACLVHGVGGMCHVSSTAALGRSSIGIYDENSVWMSSPNNSRYAVSKYDAELEVWRGIEEGLAAVIVNPGIIIGPGDWEHDSSAIFSKVAKGLKYHTRGVNGFVSVDDVSRIMVRLMEKRVCGERFVLVGDNIPFKEVMEIIAEELNVVKPYIAAGPFLSNLAWRMDSVRSMLTGKRPLITKETARSAQSTSRYSIQKINLVFDGALTDPRQYIRKVARIYRADDSAT
jgi:nucleoside-diphosphate-sugar epimerase